MLKIISKLTTSDVHEFSSTQIPLPKFLSKSIIAWGKENVPDDDVYIADDGDYGRELDQHITVKYGLHTSDPEVVKKIVDGFGSFKISLNSVSRFENDDFDVLKIDIDSKKLHELNALISDNIKHTDTHPTYKPHVTIAYVKKGKLKSLIGDECFKGQSFIADKIEFRNKNEKSQSIYL